MRLRLGLAVLLVLGTACGDDPSMVDLPSDFLDATVPMDGAAVDIDARGRFEAGLPDSDLPASGPLDAATLPRNPSGLSVQLQKAGCFGACPGFTVRVDQAGAVTFVGADCAARPGFFTKSIAASGVQSFYEELLTSPYFGLNNSYASATECPTLATYRPRQQWDVIVEDVRKPLVRDEGCTGVPDLPAIDGLVPKLVALTDVQAWIGDATTCELIRGDAPLGQLATTYRLARDGKALGIVRFSGQGFEITSCDGTLLATGTPLVQAFSTVLYDPRQTLKLGILELGSIVLIRPTVDEAVVAYGVRESDEVRLGFVESTRCTND